MHQHGTIMLVASFSSTVQITPTMLLRLWDMTEQVRLYLQMILCIYCREYVTLIKVLIVCHIWPLKQWKNVCHNNIVLNEFL